MPKDVIDEQSYSNQTSNVNQLTHERRDQKTQKSSILEYFWVDLQYKVIKRLLRKDPASCRWFIRIVLEGDLEIKNK